MEYEDHLLKEFLAKKSAHSIILFEELNATFQQIGKVSFHPAKTMIAFSARINFAYIIQMGKDFIDVVFPFKVVYEDNLCFRKIKQVPGSGDYNHHIRIYAKEDLNEEVKEYMRKAYENGL
jgi:predicted transport protein